MLHGLGSMVDTRRPVLFLTGTVEVTNVVVDETVVPKRDWGVSDAAGLNLESVV